MSFLNRYHQGCFAALIFLLTPTTSWAGVLANDACNALQILAEDNIPGAVEGDYIRPERVRIRPEDVAAHRDHIRLVQEHLEGRDNSRLEPHEVALLVEAKKAGVLIQFTDSNQASESMPLVYVDKRSFLVDAPNALKIMRHELAHVVYHKDHLTTSVPEFIFLREVDANLYGPSRGQTDAVMRTLSNYPWLGQELRRYIGEPFQPLELLKNVRQTFPNLQADFNRAYE